MIYGFVILFILRSAQRIVYGAELLEAFGIDPVRNVSNMIFFLVIAAILLSGVRLLLLVELSFQIGELVLNEGVSVADGLVVDGGAELSNEEVEKLPGLELADLLVEVVGEVGLNGANHAMPTLVGQSDPHGVAAVPIPHCTRILAD